MRFKGLFTQSPLVTRPSPRIFTRAGPSEWCPITLRPERSLQQKLPPVIALVSLSFPPDPEACALSPLISLSLPPLIFLGVGSRSYRPLSPFRPKLPSSSSLCALLPLISLSLYALSPIVPGKLPVSLSLSPIFPTLALSLLRSSSAPSLRLPPLLSLWLPLSLRYTSAVVIRRRPSIRLFLSPSLSIFISFSLPHLAQSLVSLSLPSLLPHPPQRRHPILSLALFGLEPAQQSSEYLPRYRLCLSSHLPPIFLSLLISTMPTDLSSR